MLAGRSIALATIRVARGEGRPSAAHLRDAIDRDRALLHLPPANGTSELSVAGPYAIVIDGKELDEYVVWES